LSRNQLHAIVLVPFLHCFAAGEEKGLSLQASGFWADKWRRGETGAGGAKGFNNYAKSWALFIDNK
jgi:hypothetical protein